VSEYLLRLLLKSTESNAFFAARLSARLIVYPVRRLDLLAVLAVVVIVIDLAVGRWLLGGVRVIGLDLHGRI